MNLKARSLCRRRDRDWAGRKGSVSWQLRDPSVVKLQQCWGVSSVVGTVSLTRVEQCSEGYPRVSTNM